MKEFRLLITAFIFFVLINTTHYWNGMLGFWAFPVTLILIILYLFLFVKFFYHLTQLFKERFKNGFRILVTIVLGVVLFVTFLFPAGVIDFEKYEGKDLLIAQAEGAANCMTTLKLKEGNKFVERNVCFGVREVKGHYKIKRDTIFFDRIDYPKSGDYYSFAVIKQSDSTELNALGNLIRFKDYKDTVGKKLPIIKNILK